MSSQFPERAPCSRASMKSGALLLVLPRENVCSYNCTLCLLPFVQNGSSMLGKQFAKTEFTHDGYFAFLSCLSRIDLCYDAARSFAARRRGAFATADSAW